MMVHKSYTSSVQRVSPTLSHTQQVQSTRLPKAPQHYWQHHDSLGKKFNLALQFSHSLRTPLSKETVFHCQVFSGTVPRFWKPEWNKHLSASYQGDQIICWNKFRLEPNISSLKAFTENTFKAFKTSWLLSVRNVKNERQFMQVSHVFLNFFASAFSKKVTSLTSLDKLSAKGKLKNLLRSLMFTSFYWIKHLCF